MKEPVEKDWTKVTKEELLEEAIRRYPIGTKIRDNENSKRVYVVEEIPFFYCDRWIAGCTQGGVIYCDNKWAEIISLPVPDKEFSVGTYIVFLKDYGRSKKGDVDEIIESDDVFRLGHEGVATNEEDWVKWFATKAEAEEFAKTLVEPVKEAVKQSIKLAVHCKTQEEWDFVKNNINYHFGQYDFKEYNSNSCIVLNSHNHYGSLGWAKKDGYQILSFQEWCDLNGYKMEKEVKFEVGKWYYFESYGSKAPNIAKCDELTSNFTSNNWVMVHNHVQKPSFGGWSFSEMHNSKELSIEEVQEYLPDNHPDKYETSLDKYVIGIDSSEDYHIKTKKESVIEDNFTKLNYLPE